MSLQNLKSAFSNLIETSNIEGRHLESPTSNELFTPSSIEEATQYAYNSVLGEPIEEDGGITAVSYPLMADLFNNPETTTTLNDASSDIRFQVGIGFPSPNTKLVMSKEGVEASIAYFQTGTGEMMLAASGGITKLGQASEALAKVGIDTPTFTFGVQVENPFSEGTLLGQLSKPDPVPLFLTYPMQLEEMFNPTTGNLTDEFANTGDKESTRGIVFQVLGDQNKKGITPDFSFQDKVQNEKTVEYINPVTGFTPGNIQFKDNYFKDIGQSLGSLGSALTPDFLEDGLDFMGNTLGDGIKFISENDKIRNTFKSLGGLFEGIGGFGKNIPMPKIKLPEIDFSKIGNFLQQSKAGSFLTGAGKSISNFASGVSDKVGNMADAVKDISGPIGQAAKDLASNLNPLDEFKLPQIELQNPRTVSVTEYGGQAIFKQNTPRALSRNIPMRTTRPEETADKAYVENDISTPYSKLGKVKYAGIGETGRLKAPSSYYPNLSMDEKAGGDKMTLADIKGSSLSVYDDGKPNFIDSVDNGMPFFFKDLRDNQYVIFRAYVDGITDTPSPSWSEQTYIGRSESNWVYTGTNREISFNFHLAAQTAVELDSIYYKLNRLTSMVYPEYMVDQFLQTGKQNVGGEIKPMFKVRMKPPLARMRLGDLFGNPSGQTRDGVLGFLKSLSYTWPDNSPWETRHGQRVPKLIDVTVGWQVIHEQVPDKSYPFFYGYNPDRTEAKEQAKLLNQNKLTAEEAAALGG